MEVRLNTTVESFNGNGRLRPVSVKDLKTGAVEEFSPGAVFIFIGLTPNTDFVKDFVDIDQWGFIKTGPTLETSLSSVFAAGDARGGNTKQVASAVGEGATAALMIRQHLESNQGSRGISASSTGFVKRLSHPRNGFQGIAASPLSPSTTERTRPG